MHSFTHFIRFMRGKTEDYWSIYCEFLDTECRDVKLFVFKRVRKVMNSDYLLFYVCPSVRPYGTTRLRLNGFSRLKNKNQLDATYYFIVLIIGSACFGQYYAHHQELPTKARLDSCFGLQPGQQTKNETTNVVINIIVGSS